MHFDGMQAIRVVSCKWLHWLPILTGMQILTHQACIVQRERNAIQVMPRAFIVPGYRVSALQVDWVAKQRPSS